MRIVNLLLLIGLGGQLLMGQAQQGVELPRFSAADVFELEYAADPQISLDGRTIIYVRRGANVLTDGTDSRLWALDVYSGQHRKLTLHERNESSPRWSPDAKRIAYVLSTDDGSEVYVRWIDTGQEARLATLPHSAQGLRWNPAGTHIAFSMKVDSKEQDADFALKMPPKPKDAKWAEDARVTTRLRHEADGRGSWAAPHSAAPTRVALLRFRKTGPSLTHTVKRNAPAM